MALPLQENDCDDVTEGWHLLTLKTGDTLDLHATLECGQCFQWKTDPTTEEEEHKIYIGVIDSTVVAVRDYPEVSFKVLGGKNKDTDLNKILSSSFRLDVSLVKQLSPNYFFLT